MIVHYSLHFLLPGVIARVFFRDQRLWVWFVMVATMLVDLDHLLATPIFDANRCSIGFHPLHTWPIIGVYVVMCFFPETRVVGIGLVMHMLTDAQDCLRM